MPQMPTKREIVEVVHQWSIEVPCTAKDLRFQVFQIEKQIEALIGSASNNDDAYSVSVGDDKILFEVEVKQKVKKGSEA